MVRALQYQTFWFDLAFLLNTGRLPLAQALSVICRQLSDADEFDCGIKKIVEDIQGGRSFAEALNTSAMFSTAEVCAIKAAQISGMMATVVMRIAQGQIPSRADQYRSFYAILGNLLACGTPILQALKESEKGLDPPLQSAVQQIHDVMSGGNWIAQAMSETKQFSPMEVNIIDQAEQQGGLDQVLMRLADLSRCYKPS
ncbi:MAG: type II secretion system F family protein [Candidatus Buchananbacteria bacterium]